MKKISVIIGVFVFMAAFSVGLKGVSANATTTNATSTGSVYVASTSATVVGVAGGQSGNTIGANVTFQFTLVNTTAADVFLSKIPALDVATSTLGSVGNPSPASSTLTYVQVNPEVYASDTKVAYVVLAGTSRIFTLHGSLDNTNGVAGLRVFKITQINYGTTASNPKGYTITSGLTNLIARINLLSDNPTTPPITGTTTPSITARLSPRSPLERTIVVSPTEVTKNVVLGVFTLTSHNRPSILQGISFRLDGTTKGMTHFKISSGDFVDNGTLVGGVNPLNFAISTPLERDVNVDFTVTADIPAGMTNSQVTLVFNGDLIARYAETKAVKFSVPAISAKTINFSTGGLLVSNTTAQSSIISGASGNVIGANVTFSFTLTNTSSSTDVFISKIPGLALGTSTLGSVGNPAEASSSLTYEQANPDTLASDTGIAPKTGAFVIPAGTSRTFTFHGMLDNTNGTAGNRVFRINKINYGKTASNTTGQSITSGLNNLVVFQNLSGRDTVPRPIKSIPVPGSHPQIPTTSQNFTSAVFDWVRSVFGF